MSARDLAQELGLKIRLPVRKWSDNQPRVPAGSGRESGRWTSGDAAGGSNEAPLVEGRSAGTDSGKVKKAPGLPKDAIVVIRPDSSTIDDPESPTGKLMAPPRANFKEVYAAGERIANWPLMQQRDSAKTALQQFGTYDFQREKATNTWFSEYVHAANYAVGVYMAGAGYGLYQSLAIAQAYAVFNSSNAFDDKYKGREWKIKGWEDAHQGDWR